MRTGLKWKLWYQYLYQKATFASFLTLQKCSSGQIVPKEVWSTVMKTVFTEEMLYFYRSKGSEMKPTISARDTLVVRRLPYLNAGLRQHNQPIYVNDVVVLKDPLDSDNHVVRRIAAVSGHEMVSTDEKDEPFVIEDDQCWVLSDNKNLKPGESKDSRTYGPISMTDIVGRVIYRFRTLKDHGFMINNKLSMNNDMPVLYAELDTVEMQRFTDQKDDESRDSQT